MKHSVVKATVSYWVRDGGLSQVTVEVIATNNKINPKTIANMFKVKKELIRPQAETLLGAKLVHQFFHVDIEV